MSPQVEERAAVAIETEQPQQGQNFAEQRSLLEQAMDRPVTQENEAFDLALRYAAPAADSRYWSDAAAIPQALMKILAGRELGLSPIVSLQAVYIVKGKVSISGDMIATKLREKGYTWGFAKHDADGCTLAFFRGWEADGTPRPLIDPATKKQITVSFTRAEAEAADLAEPRAKAGDTQKKTSGMYDKYPKSMYFNRCLAFFRRWYAPEVTNGVNVYAPEELNVTGEDAASLTNSQASSLRDRLQKVGA